MPNLDTCHRQVVRALKKDGWDVDDKPKSLRLGDRRAYIDAIASRRINGTNRQVFLVEIKCFPIPRQITTDLYTAIGQYIVYRTLILQLELDIPLYLAIPKQVYEDQAVFDSTIQQVISDYVIKLVIIDLDQEVVVSWK